jgi:hypothetical protein
MCPSYFYRINLPPPSPAVPARRDIGAPAEPALPPKDPAWPRADPVGRVGAEKSVGNHGS